MEDTYIRFEPNPLKIQAWRERLLPNDNGPPHSTDSPAELYARAVPTLLRWKDRLLESQMWREVRDANDPSGMPPGMLFVLESTGGGAPSSPTVDAHGDSLSYISRNPSASSVWAGSVSSTSSAGVSFLESVRSGGGSVPDDAGMYSRNPSTSTGAGNGGGGAVLALPAELSAFIEYRTQLEDIFQDPLLFYPYLDRKQELILEAFDEATPTHDHDLSVAASTLTDIFYLLQLLIPGMLLIVHDTLTFVNEFNMALPTERNPSHSPRHHGRAATTFAMSLSGGESPAPSPKEFNPPIPTREGGTSRVMLTRTRRGVPPAQWIRNYAGLLEGVFGRASLRAFRECAEDRSRSMWTTVYAADGKRLELGADLDFSQVEDDVQPTHLESLSGSRPTGPTPGREAHNVYLDFTRRSRTL